VVQKDHKIEHAVLAVINDDDGSLCGLNYKRRCELAEFGLFSYCGAVKRLDPSLKPKQVRKAGELIQAYYQNHAAEIQRIENERLNDGKR